jgi:serine/threonine protein kinase/Flp pilus assembly protein TadD
MVGTRLTHYQVLEHLGAGGMGVVFRARDERLQREVALKLLPEGALADPNARREFLREAVAASRVNHPNIGVVHEFATDGTRDFIVMELVAGESLETRLQRGALPEPEVASLGLQLASALEALHALGIAHFDLKPDNVVLGPTGTAKIVDFGLSRWTDPEASPVQSTKRSHAALAGTLAYMAPERFEEGTADACADLWSLGVLLYRAACGRLPFEARDVPSLLYAIHNTEPPAPRSLVPSLSAGFESVLRRALAPRPADRFATAAEMAAALREGPGAAPPAPGRIRSLAVLPLANLSGRSEQDFFVDGMTEALLAGLSRLEDVRVISSTSAMRYRGSSLSLPQIARELGVEAVIEGSVLRAGNDVRVTARLVDAYGDRSLWSCSYERAISDVLALQSELAESIAVEVHGHLAAGPPAASARRAAVPPEAYELYLRGRHLWNRRTVDDVRQALKHFEDAVAIAPGFAQPHAGMADAYNILGDLTSMRADLARTSAMAAAQRALALDPDLPEAHTSVGFVRFFHEWDWPGAESSFRQAVAFGPGWATAHQWFGEFLAGMGRFEEAEAHARQAVELDPLAFVMHTSLADVLYFARRYDDAIAVLRDAIEIAPEHLWARMDLGRVLTQLGRFDEALREFDIAFERMAHKGRAAGGRVHALARAGRHDEARALLPDLEARAAAGESTQHSVAVVRLELGERDAALDWLERGVHTRDRALVWMRVHPRLDALRGEPRFEQILASMKFPERVHS